MSVSKFDYSVLAAHSHHSARSEQNLPPTNNLNGFTMLDSVNLHNIGSGFEASIYRRGNDIVIAFAGTDDNPDIWTDLQTFFAGVNGQLDELVKFYQRAVELARTEGVVDPQFSFTGHSLGGGLAGVAAVWFDKPAVAFDSAPFLNAVDNYTSVDRARDVMVANSSQPQISAMQRLAEAMTPPAALANDDFTSPIGHAEYLALLATPDYAAVQDEIHRRIGNVENYYTHGELLTTLPSNIFRINYFDQIEDMDLGHDSFSYLRDVGTPPNGNSGWDLHAGTLFNTNYFAPQFAELSRRLWHLVPETFDAKVEERALDAANPSFLERVTYSQMRGGNLLTSFVADLDKVKTDVPWQQQEVPEQYNAALYDGIASNYVLDAVLLKLEKSQPVLQGLIDTAINYYSRFRPDYTDPTPIFTEGASGTVAVDAMLVRSSQIMDKIGPQRIRAYVDARMKAADNASPYGVEKFDIASEWVLPTQSNVRGVSSSKEFFDSFVMGSLGDDRLDGSEGDDVLFGDAGDDILRGAGAGKDILIGGAGNDSLFGNAEDKMYGGVGKDHYIVVEGGQIEDTDGKGDVRFNGVVLTVGYKKSKDGNVYTDNANGVKYTWNDDTLIIRQGGASTPLIITKWHNGDLGITLKSEEPDPADPKEPDPYKVPIRKDPLVLDLDGDGIETVGPNDGNPGIYFDASGSGVATLSGWVKPDDAFLALDRNGNGRIDNGRELFGDATPLAFGGTAVDGFDALVQEDTNSDGWIDASDAHFADLRLWRDLNQNGVSDPGELKTLAETGIEAIRVSNTGNKQELNNGNRVADLGTFRWADGHAGAAAVVGNAADVDLAQDLRDQNLPPVEIDPAVASLPQLAGRGRVYDLHSAASLSPSFAAQLAAFATMDRAAQEAAVDALIYAWARTSDMTPLRERGEALGIDVVYDNFQRTGHNSYARPSDRPYLNWPGEGELASDGWVRTRFSAADWDAYEDFFESRIFSLEAMQGSYFQVLPGESSFNGSLPGSVTLDASGEDLTMHVTWAASRLGVVLDGRYENLRQQIYEQLIAQTRLADVLAPLSNAALTPQQAFEAVEALLRSEIAADRTKGIGDLIDVNAIMLRRFGNDARWGGAELLADAVRAAPLTDALADLLKSWRVYIGDTNLLPSQQGARTFVPLSNALAQIGGSQTDWMVGTQSNDYFDGQPGDDWLQGEGGDDQLFGGDGNDLIEGGTGNDVLAGGAGNDRYRFGRGDGNDRLFDSDGSNTLVLTGALTQADLAFSRLDNDLLIAVRNSADSVRVANFFKADGSLAGFLTGIEFESGGFLDPGSLSDLVAAGDGRAQTLLGTSFNNEVDAGGGNDTVRGMGGRDTLRGGEGRDLLDGGDGDDLLYGGDDKDTLLGGAGNDLLHGDAGADTLDGGAGDDVLAGGRGNDILTGGAGYDRFEFNVGDGFDTITDAGQSGPGEELRFGAGITAAGLRVARQGDDLLLQVGDTTDRLRLTGWFASGAVPIDRFAFADGTVLTAQQLRARLGDVGNAGATVIGTTGADTLQGASGNDLLSGGEGNDQLLGGDGSDQLLGGPGADILDGGVGNDILVGGDGSDTIRFGPGAGQDTVMGVDTSAGRVDRVLMGNSVRATDVLLYRAGNDLLVMMRGQSDMLRIVDHFAPASDPRQGSGIDRIDFNDGTRWTVAQIATKAVAWTGAALPAVPTLPTEPVPAIPASLDPPLVTAADDQTLDGTETDDPSLTGGEGDDKLYGLGGNDVIKGGTGQDLLDGGAGNDTLSGDGGQDVLIGGPGSDTYLYQRGDGSDTIINQDTADTTDVLKLTGIAAADVLVRREGADLVVYIGAPGQVQTARETGDAIRLNAFFAAGGTGRIDSVVFDHDPAWTSDELARRAQTGSEFDDVLVLSDADEVLDALGGNDLVMGGGGKDTLSGGSGADNLDGEAGDDVLSGGSEADVLSGGDDDDTLNGDDGDDLLDGGAGNDVLVGGRGNDTLDGGAGNDVLRGGLGGGTAGSGIAGNDRITMGAGEDLLLVGLDDAQITLDARDPGVRETDTLRFDAGTAPADVQIAREGDDLLLSIAHGPVVRVTGHFGGNGDTAATLERIEFAGDPSTVWTAELLRLRSLTATPGNDQLSGFDADETIDGLAGDDTIDGRAGSDTLIGNTGNDRLSGGEGADRYVFNPGWGHDTITNADSVAGRDEIVFGPGIDPASLTVRRAASDLVIGNGTDSVQVSGFFVNEGVSGNAPARVLFSDAASTVWDLATIKARALLGTPGDDRITGHATDDTITGGAGDDTLIGGDGHDTYVFARGFGHDRIENNEAARTGDRVRFAADIAVADVSVSRAGNDLWLRVGTDSIQVAYYFEEGAAEAWRLDSVSFDAAPGVVWDRATLVSLSSVATEGDDVFTGTPGPDTFDALGGNDRLLGDAGDDVLSGGEGSDLLQGGAGNDTLRGGAGADDLYGDAGDDILDGGAGDDNLDGGAGRDTIVLKVGGGHDWLTPAAEADRVDASTLHQADLRITRTGNDLVITIIATGENLRVQNHFSGAPRIDELKLADATLDAAAIALAATGATAGDDTLYGSAGDDVIDGLAGNDTLYGQGGNDRLIGGPGNDVLSGGPGNDVFVFGPGGGADSIDAYDTGVGRVDTVEFSAGILPSAVTVRRERFDGDDLVLQVSATDSVRIENFFALDDGLGAYGIQQVRFADGTVWTTTELQRRALLGGAGDDQLWGYAGNDVLVGGRGNDLMDGGAGSDVYMIERGDGHDTIQSNDASAGRIDTVRFGTGIAAADLTLRRVPSDTPLGFNQPPVPDDLLIELSAAAGGGTVRVRQFFTDGGQGAYRIDRIEFVDGSPALDLAAILGALAQGTSGDDVIHGTSGADTIDGLAGNDTLYGEGGDDTLIGGPGNDLLDGGAGNDTYRFASGFGQDTIDSNDPGVGKTDTAVFEGLTRAQVRFSRNALDLFVTVIATGDQLRVANAFLVDDQNARQVDRFVFTDQTLTQAQVRALLLVPTEGDDTLYGSSNSESIDALGGNDVVHASGGNDAVQGGAGNDMLYGEDGDDVLDGGAGDDVLAGGRGSDTYRFGLGRGHDIVDASVPDSEASLDKVLIDAGVLPSQITMSRSFGDLIINAPDGGSLRVQNFFTLGQVGRVNTVQFADGTVWDTNYIRTHSGSGTDGNDFFVGDETDNVFYLYGGNDTATGAGGNDYIDGGDGNDYLQGQNGNDTLDGGEQDHGFDTLDGGPGDDTYLFGLGDGQDSVSEGIDPGNGDDRVLFRPNLTPATVSFRRDGDALIVGTPAGDSLRIGSWFTDTRRMERFEFADGTVWREDDILARLPGPTAGNDWLTGTNGDDAIDGLAGGDSMYGRRGNDTLLGNAGNDSIYGEDGNDILHGNTDNDYLNGGNGDDFLYGDEGNDQLVSGAGTDVLEGGPGNDSLSGSSQDYPISQSGATTYRFAPGWGIDTVNENGQAGTIDTLEFYGGVTSDQLTVRRLLQTSSGITSPSTNLAVSAGSDRITVFGQDTSFGAIEQFRFLDASGAVVATWDAARIAAEMLKFTGGDDVIVGTTGADLLQGGAGNDTLWGNGASTGIGDTFEGGSGNDVMIGEWGADIYRFAAGFGQDTVRDQGRNGTALDEVVFDGLASTAFTFRRSGDDLLITRTADPTDQLKIERHFGFDYSWGTISQRIERFTFSDGTLTPDDILARMNQATEGDDVITGTAGDDVYDALGGNDIVRGEGGNDIIDGGAGDDQLEGGAGSDTLRGGTGDDKLYDGSTSSPDVGNDILEGGPGSDDLRGGSGADIYRVAYDGQWYWDRVDNYAYDGVYGNDQLQLVGGILPSQVTVQRYGPYDMRLVIGEVGVASSTELTSVLVQLHFNSIASAIGTIRFDDGTVWNSADITARAQSVSRYNDWYIGTSGDDVADGGNGDDRMEGNGGTDILHGGNGDDFMVVNGSTGELYGDDGNDQLSNGALADGGAGNDRISDALVQRGGTGDDILLGYGSDNIYRFAHGDGHDTLTDYGGLDRIVFDAGVLRSDLDATVDGQDVLLNYGTGDQIRIVGALDTSQGGEVIDSVELDSGETLTLADLLEGLLVGDDDDNDLDGTAGDDVILALGGSDTVHGRGGNDRIDGGSGDDSLYGEEGNDTLIGGEGNDLLDGGDNPGDSDVLDGGEGDDELHGDSAATRYRFRDGDGHDTVTDYDFGEHATDVLQLADGIGTDDLRVQRDGDDLVVRLKAGGDDMRFVDWFDGDGFTGIEQIEFHDSDGNLAETWDRNRMAQESSVQMGTDGDDNRTLTDDDDFFDALAGDDHIEGRGGNDLLIGGGGSDQLYGEDGNDTLDGSGGGYDELDGGGDDDILISTEGSAYLSGNSGNDEYRIGTGDGGRYIFDPQGDHDTVVLSAAIDPASLVVAVDGNGLFLERSDAPNWSLTLWGMLDPAYMAGGAAANSDGPIETLQFAADGSTLTAAQLRAMLSPGLWVQGAAGDDASLQGDGRRNSIWGFSGNDHLSGGAGADWLYGGEGNDDYTGGTGDDWLEDQSGGSDTYRYARGDGADYVIDNDNGHASEIDRLVLAAGIAPADVSVHLDGEDSVRFEIAGSGDADRIVVLAWRQAEHRNQLERIEFADGTVWTAADVDAFIGSGTALPAAAADRRHGLSAGGMADAMAAFFASADDDALGVHGWAAPWVPALALAERLGDHPMARQPVASP